MAATARRPRPRRLRDTFFPINRPDIPGRNARGYSLPLGDQGPPCWTARCSTSPSTTPIGQGAGYGLGLLVLDTPCGRLIGHDGGIPGFITIVLSTQDGRRQLGVMVNEFFTTPAVDQAYSQVVVQIAMRLLEGGPCDPDASGASLEAIVRAGELACTQQTLARARVTA